MARIVDPFREGAVVFEGIFVTDDGQRERAKRGRYAAATIGHDAFALERRDRSKQRSELRGWQQRVVRFIHQARERQIDAAGNMPGPIPNTDRTGVVIGLQEADQTAAGSAGDNIRNHIGICEISRLAGKPIRCFFDRA